MTRLWILIVLLTGAVLNTPAQDRFILKRDLHADWLTNVSGTYQSYSNAEDPVKTIYFSVDAEKFKGDFLVIGSEEPFALMINGKLMVDQQISITLPIDSLQALTGQKQLFVAVHQEHGIEQLLSTTLQTKIISNPRQTEEQGWLRKETFFRDFVISMSIVLLIFLISMIRLNPRLSYDYFSFTKIFSLRDYETDQFYYRLTSGAILFYIFASLILAFYLMVINQHVETGLGNMPVTDFTGSLLAWLKMALVILGFLFLKLLIVQAVAPLFGVRDVAGFHFFNFIRLLLITLGILSLTLVIYYVLHGQRIGFYSFLYYILLWILGGWVILLFLKLVNRVQYSVFHIFSYICATEIIPFLLIIKVLN